MLTARLLRIVALAFSLAAAASSGAAAAGFPVPPAPKTHVDDAAGALSAATVTSLEDELRAFEKASGDVIVVYVGQTTGGEPLESYTVALAHAWGVGHKGKDDGAILFLFLQDHKVRIEVGYGLEGKLTDADSSDVIQNRIVPRMRDGDVDGAVTDGVAGMLAAIDPSFTVTATAAPASGDVEGNAAGAWFALLLVVCFAVPVIFFIWRIVLAARHGDLVRSAGGAAAGAAAGGFFGGGGGSDSSSDDSSSDDDVDSGGDFGGGGASGSW